MIYLQTKTELSAKQEEILQLSDSVARLKQKLKQREENEQVIFNQILKIVLPF